MKPVFTKVAAVCSFSGGKDSVLSLYKALHSGYKVKYLLNFVSKKYNRCCFHGIDNNLMKLQAEAIGIPLIQKKVSPDMQKYEQEFKESVTKLKQVGIKTMVFGDIYLIDHYNWIKRVCKELKIIPIEPLWNIPPKKIVKEFIELGFKAIIVSAKTDLFDKNFVGKVIDENLIIKLEKRNICPCGENGEFHTFVFDGPIFKKRIEIIETKKILKKGFWNHWFLDIKKYKVVNKT